MKKPVASIAVVPDVAITIVRVLQEQGYRCTNLTVGSFTDMDKVDHQCLWFDIESE